MAEYFYDFRIGGENRGYSYLRHQSDSLYSLTRFQLDGDEI